jgi:glycosyltransferase involved in cell wall biosynthesis
MKVNIIWNSRRNTGISQDIGILRGILSAVFEKNIEVFSINHVMPECNDADYNIFVEVINPSLFSYARTNIWIPNPEWTYTAWKPYLDMVDEIWCKTQEAVDIFLPLTNTTVRYIGWTSIDKVWNSDTHRKNYFKAIVPIGKNIYRHPKPVFQAYLRFLEENPTLYSKLPILHAVYDPAVIQVTVPDLIKDKVILHAEIMKESAYDELLRECGLCICTSLAEGFCHAVNEAMSSGCNLILSPIAAFKHDLVGETLDGVIYGSIYDTVAQPDCMSKFVDTSVDSIVDGLMRYISKDFKERRSGSLAIRESYEHRHKKWIETMKLVLPQVMPIPDTPYSLKDTLPKEDELPDVSILTITKDRRVFMPLAKYSYMIQSYPEDKLEWVIVDDGDDPIEDTLIGVPNVTYVRCEKGLTISQKRNLAVEKAMYDILVTMDDDDVYPNNSVIQRVAMLQKKPTKGCGFCTTIPCYDIIQFSSFMNVPPRQLTFAERVSEASLVFTRSFWEEGKFDDKIHIGEGHAFIRGREQMCREISPQDVIVSLMHPLNTSSRKSPKFNEPNGCHYGFNEKLFEVVSQIGEEIKKKLLADSESNSGGQTVSDRDECGGDHHGENGGDDHPSQGQQGQQPLA